MNCVGSKSIYLYIKFYIYNKYEDPSQEFTFKVCITSLKEIEINKSTEI